MRTKSAYSVFQKLFACFHKIIVYYMFEKIVLFYAQNILCNAIFAGIIKLISTGVIFE